MEILTLVGRVILVVVAVSYLVYFGFFVLSFDSIFNRFSHSNAPWLALVRAILHILLSPGAIPAAFAVVVLIVANKNIFLLSMVSLVWFVANLAISFVISPFFIVWLIVQVVWFGLFVTLWVKAIV
ncbi:hypothetical protein [Paraburkholderia unamae]|uniref:hypothetical protein n=1 Tax=Paraburkholderia unamae TaxID=219649 RepID=UPI001CC7126B|nr:hypothetical protein [Paraburkholderia unamae]